MNKPLYTIRFPLQTIQLLGISHGHLHSTVKPLSGPADTADFGGGLWIRHIKNTSPQQNHHPMCYYDWLCDIYIYCVFTIMVLLKQYIYI